MSAISHDNPSQLYPPAVTFTVCPPGIYHGREITAAAAARARQAGRFYALAEAPTSPHPQLYGNEAPGTTHLGWLRGKNKCHVFVGDVLTDAGVRAPTVARGGALDYARADAWPRRHDLFGRVVDRRDVRAGDLIVKTYPLCETDPPHIEVITNATPIRSIGAHWDGACERDIDLLAGTSLNPCNGSFDNRVGAQVYVLRPLQRLAASSENDR